MLVEVQDGLADAGGVGEAQVFDGVNGVGHAQRDFAAAVEFKNALFVEFHGVCGPIFG